jgi:hypothetical protein
MSRDQLSSGSFEGNPRPDLAGLGDDQIEAVRLSEVLSAVEAGDDFHLDASEDPILTSLSATAGSLRSSIEAASTRASFDTFHQRSRRHVLAATPQRIEVSGRGQRESLLHRWNGLFTSVSSAAAAAVATFVVTVLAIGGSTSTEPLASVQVADSAAGEARADDPLANAAPSESQVNLTALSVDDQIVRYRSLLDELSELTEGGQPADVGLLREIADTSATVARTIEEQPGSVSGASAWDAYHATFEAQQTLSEASVASGDDQVALDTAQVVADGAFVTAARYLGNPALAPSYDEVVAAVPPGSATP